MRRYMMVLMVLLLTGCAGATDEVGRPLTIFGYLSELVQLGGTEETIVYKMQTERKFVTIRGEVLPNRPAYLDLVVTDQVDGSIVDDLAVTVELCHAVDETIRRLESCDETAEGGLHHLIEPARLADGRYLVDGFEWPRTGIWALRITFEGDDLTAPEQIEMRTQVYPQRPPSSNLFELSNISLPFMVIGLFLLGVWWRNGRFVERLVEEGG